MKTRSTLFLLFVTLFAFSNIVKAQEREVPKWRMMKYLSEEEMNMPVRNLNFIETPPPTGEVRFPGEYEPMQAVMIVYPLGIPVDLVREMAEDCKVIVIARSSDQSYAESEGGPLLLLLP